MIVIENVGNEIVLLEKLICNGTKQMYQELKEKNVGIIDVVLPEEYMGIMTAQKIIDGF